MAILAGKTLQLEVPISALKRMGHVEGTETIQNFVEEIVRQFEDNLTPEQKERFSSVIPYLANAILLSPVISEMIESDSTFSVALSSSEESISDSIEKFTDFIKSMNEDDDFKSIYKTFSDAMFQMSKELLDKIKELNSDYLCSISLSNISFKLSNAIQRLGILDVSTKIAYTECVRDSLRQNFIEPLRDALCNSFKVLQDTHHLGDDDMAELLEELDEQIKIYYFYVPLQSVLSIILEKAISDDITVSAALSTFDVETLTEMSIARIQMYDKISEFKDSMEKMLKTIFNLMD